MQDEHGGLRRGGIDFFQGRHPSLGKLKLTPAANHAHPLTRGCALGLLLQHPQSIGERRHAVPAELHVVIQSATNDVKVRVVESRDEAAAFEIDDHGARAALVSFVNSEDAPIFDSKAPCFRVAQIERGDAAVVENQIRLR